MGAISGQQYIDRINQLNPEIWADGKRISGLLSEHPLFKGLILSKAALYDLQHNPKIKDELTFPSPISGDVAGLSFLAPKTKEDLLKRRKMIEHWATHTHGIMGRSPDYLNTVLMSFASSADYLNGKEKSFPENLIRLYETAREKI